MSYQAFFVLGPEATGNRVLTAALARAGCVGQKDWKDHSQILDDSCQCSFAKGYKDPKCAFKQAADSQQSIVWRRSMPHGREWPDLNSMLRRVRSHSFDDVKIILPIRNNFCTLRAQVK